MESQKQENLLRLATSSTRQEREKSEILNVGISEEENLWEIIVKYAGEIDQLQAMGIGVEKMLSGYAILTLTKQAIEVVSTLPMIEYLELPKSLIYGIYEAKIASCIPQVRQSPYGLTGKGVLLAVIDSGIDYFLEDFKKEGKTRICYLWDQTGEPNIQEGKLPPEGFLLGVEYNKEQIDKALQSSTRKEALQIVPQVDERGHGTAVAAVAASSHPQQLLQGVAPDCDLLIVKLRDVGNSGYPSTTELMRAVTYCIQKARLLAQPLVINLSFGNSYGPRDGSSLIEQFLDQAATMGKTSICIGCGNEGVSGGHFAGNVRETKTVELAIGRREPTVNVQLWKFYEDDFSIELEAPDGTVFPVVLESNPGRQTFLWQSTKVLVYGGIPSPYSSKQEVFFAFLPQDAYLDMGLWTFRFHPQRILIGEIQLYLPTRQQRNEDTGFLLQEPSLTMTNPATAARVISVAAYEDATGAYADFSGRGEAFQRGDLLWEERNKPDLAAPGVGIIASSVGGGVQSYTGTSFATPMVSGSAALLMEWGIVRGNDPYLYGEKMKAYLRKGAKSIRGESVYPNNRVGWGALCVADSIPSG